MTLIPTLTEFLGYGDPGRFAIESMNTNGVPQTAVGPLPHFRLRQVTTSAIVWDGQTVVLSALIPRQTANQSPTMGDLPGGEKSFRDHERTLLIFVTPTIIDPAGNRIHTAEELNALPATRR